LQQLLLPWRFFRLWALADGIDAPENMVRCMANNYSTLGFWRSWHRSYNLWLIRYSSSLNVLQAWFLTDNACRYIYIPLGGTKNIAISTILIFTFVALWHDLSFRLLAWGWLISLFIAPELAAIYLLPPSKVRSLPYDRLSNQRWPRMPQYGSRAWYRHVCAGGAVFNILMMVSANLVGFAIGTEGMKYMITEIIGTWSGKFLWNP
jgi:D-alanyl-lipoteichoic acid acyltransferase DltB (MBOAT superfamily)